MRASFIAAVSSIVCAVAAVLAVLSAPAQTAAGHDAPSSAASTTSSSADEPAAPDPVSAPCGRVTLVAEVTTAGAPELVADAYVLAAGTSVPCLAVQGCWVRVELPPDAPDIYAPDRQHWVPAAATDRGCAVG